jgi:hypothetical protein
VQELKGLSDHEREELEKFIPHLLNETMGFEIAKSFVQKTIRKLGTNSQTLITVLEDLGVSQDLLKDLLKELKEKDVG